MKFEIAYGLGGGFGGTSEWEPTDAITMEDAQEHAYQCACETYESYEGIHGIRSVYEIMEEDGWDEEEATVQYHEERDSWLAYKVREVK